MVRDLLWAHAQATHAQATGSPDRPGVGPGWALPPLCSFLLHRLANARLLGKATRAAKPAGTLPWRAPRLWCWLLWGVCRLWPEAPLLFPSLPSLRLTDFLTLGFPQSVGLSHPAPAAKEACSLLSPKGLPLPGLIRTCLWPVPHVSPDLPFSGTDREKNQVRERRALFAELPGAGPGRSWGESRAVGEPAQQACFIQGIGHSASEWDAFILGQGQTSLSHTPTGQSQWCKIHSVLFCAV